MSKSTRPLPNLSEYNFGRSRPEPLSDAKVIVMLGSDHLAHMLIDYSQGTYDIPLDPNGCMQLAGTLLEAAKQIQALAGALKFPAAGASS
jgi:hypothetical protein